MNRLTATHPESFDHDSDRSVIEALSGVPVCEASLSFAEFLRGQLQKFVIATLNEDEP